MVPQLDLSVGRRRPRMLAPVAGAAVVVVLGLLLVLAHLAVIVALLAMVVAGAGLTFLSGLRLSLEERMAYGAVVGALVVALAQCLLSLVGGLTLGTALGGLGLALAAGGAGWYRGRRLLSSEWVDARERWGRLEAWPLLLLLLVCWPYTILLLARAYQVVDGSLLVGNIGVYGDWAAHLTYAGSFAYGDNLPPRSPIAPDQRLAYPFLVDFLAAGLVPLGASLTASLVWSSGLLGLAFPAVMYTAGRRLVGSSLGGALGTLVFLLSGGLGFVRVAGDVAHTGLGALAHLSRLSTQDPEANLQWLNPVLGWLLPQRSVLLGFPLALLLLALLWRALEDREPTARQAFGFAGVLAGLLPLAHLHAYGTVLVLAAFWAVFERRREWLTFFVPALLLGLPQVAWLATGTGGQPRWQIWWLADTGGHADGPLWFWLKNLGLFVPLLLAAFLWRPALPAQSRLRLAPIWLWFLIPNLLVFQPWDWDNTKFFAYWALLGSLVIGALLARLLSRGRLGPVLAAVCLVLLVLSGGLDLARSLDQPLNQAQFADRGGLETAAWVRTNTDRHAIFLVAPEHNEPVPALAGRSVAAGYPGWLWSYGIPDWQRRAADADRMLRGDPETPALLRRYHVSYVVLGPQELGGHQANAAYWNSAALRVYANSTYTVYRIVGPG
ncbi:MAG: hypothetical protein M3Y62_00495 [Candidatus Dormibacteraeota bacterium]|nr:hypothetical protein [Candidatus Dormibacteraeota bacterium]